MLASKQLSLMAGCLEDKENTKMKKHLFKGAFLWCSFNYAFSKNVPSISILLRHLSDQERAFDFIYKRLTA